MTDSLRYIKAGIISLIQNAIFRGSFTREQINARKRVDLETSLTQSVKLYLIGLQVQIRKMNLFSDSHGISEKNLS